MKASFILFASLYVAVLHAQPIPIGKVLPASQTPVHDPVMIKEKDRWYLFCTGNGITVWSSGDLLSWRNEKQVFEKPPEWAMKAVPGFRGSIWAPDISYHNGRYYLYYAVSAFGKNTSCIGLAINKTLDTASPDFKWVDKGKVLQSVPGRDQWNAIDPNLVIDNNGVPWLAFGSFWEGIKLVKLSPDLLSVAEPQEWHSIARRSSGITGSDSSAGEAAIEAPFVFKRERFYYLFVSQDYCCRAEKSNYKVVVGRSENITGPYLDRMGIAMTRGGGTIVVKGNSNWYGAGHNAVYHDNGIDWNIFHGYDAKDNGRSKLIIQQVQWDGEGWPVLQELK